MKEDKVLDKLCLKVSEHLFNNKDKYDPYTTVVIKDSSIEVVQSMRGIPVRRYEEEV